MSREIMSRENLNMKQVIYLFLNREVSQDSLNRGKLMSRVNPCKNLKHKIEAPLKRGKFVSR